VASALRALVVLVAAAAIAIVGAQLALHRGAWRAAAARRTCRDDDPPPVIARLWHVLRESALACAVLLAWPFGADDPAADRRTPVVLLHGFLSAPASLWLLARRLRRDGWLVVVPRLGAMWRDLDDAVTRVAWRLEQVRERHGASDLIVVAHGIAGLAVRRLVGREGRRAGIRLLVTLGTPHGGTEAAPWLGRGPLRRDVRPGSELLRTLERMPLPPRTEAVAIASPDDAVIVPPEHARWPEACTISIAGSGHLHLLVSARTYAVLHENLAASVAPTRQRHVD
jgi:triacylglycerol esterase/lipase EstA (alpha/beta hydrolase family)